ncbi:hypothetical protein E2C01_033222 [Portunus trituberculatus]|uniref:Uncharacterized protein n=1 Tax=Portunus trituberculatus TaxID=210409 RepID=A0A5B7F2F1_PORTR|nr:hypothetical protein [Portunus trituberculatus]
MPPVTSTLPAAARPPYLPSGYHALTPLLTHALLANTLPPAVHTYTHTHAARRACTPATIGTSTHPEPPTPLSLSPLTLTLTAPGHDSLSHLFLSLLPALLQPGPLPSLTHDLPPATPHAAARDPQHALTATRPLPSLLTMQSSPLIPERQSLLPLTMHAFPSTTVTIHHNHRHLVNNTIITTT